ncbi:hypothetical protein PRIC1_014103 [Phytophthora ramorum]|uniref:uncharacterized protein n=1 Tax=Phytophthora ramorum TaxID=164328 RepID=UPI0030B47909|nr:hypothetical protein KRP23_10802 [Phytophthora ramorum]KAH7491212.1 hypothetical protein KRP23_137 [Phytophthora ramorum]KAH7495954.1 hypothetical protein KRP22_14250 [Phytophthora ramorum]
MRTFSIMLVVAATLLVSGNALSTPDMTLSKTASTGVNNGARSLRRSLKTVHAGNDKDIQDEERGNNILNAIDDVFNPKTVEQLRQRAINQGNDEFYSNIVKNVSERAKRFAGWKSDRLGYDQVRQFMEFHKRSEDEILAMIAKYQHYIKTGEVK